MSHLKRSRFFFTLEKTQETDCGVADLILDEYTSMQKKIVGLK